MVENLLPPPETKKRQVPTPEELLRQKQELFREIRDLFSTSNFQENVGAPPGDVANYLMKEILSHSIDDGLEAAQLMMSLGANTLELMSSSDFFFKHPGFSVRLEHQIHLNKNYVSPQLRVFFEIITDVIHAHNYSTSTREPNREPKKKSIPNGIKPFIEDIQAYYAHFLPLRKVKEKETYPINDLRSRGEQIGEEALMSSNLARIPHLYAGPVKKLIRKAYGFDHSLRDDEVEERLVKEGYTRVQSIFHNNLISLETVEEALKVGGKDPNDPDIKRALDKARYKPLDLIHNLKQEEGEKTLKNEIIQTLATRGYEKDRIEFVLDDKTKKYRIIYKSKERKEEIKEHEEKTEIKESEKVTDLDVKELGKRYKAFLEELYEHFGISPSSSSSTYPYLVKVDNIEWQDPEHLISRNMKHGEYTLNPETQDIDWEKIPEKNIKILTLPHIVGASFNKIAEEITKIYGHNHYIPGIEYLKWLTENPDKAPPFLKRGLDKCYSFFGSIIQGNSPNIPGIWVNEIGAKLKTISDLHSEWDKADRAIIIEKEGIELNKPEEFKLDLTKFERKEIPDASSGVQDIEVIGKDVYILTRKGMILKNGKELWGTTIHNPEGDLIKIGNKIFLKYKKRGIDVIESVERAEGKRIITGYEKITEVIDVNGKLVFVAQNKAGTWNIRGEDETQIDAMFFPEPPSNLKEIGGKLSYVSGQRGKEHVRWGHSNFGPYELVITPPIECNGDIVFAATRENESYFLVINGHEFKYKEEIIGVHNIGGKLHVEVWDYENKKTYFIYEGEKIAVGYDYTRIGNVTDINGSLAFTGGNKQIERVHFWPIGSDQINDQDVEEIYNIRGKCCYETVAFGGLHNLVSFEDRSHISFERGMNVAINDDIVFIGGFERGKYFSYIFDSSKEKKEEKKEEKEEGDITDQLQEEEIQRLKLLNTMQDPTPEKITAYFWQADDFSQSKGNYFSPFLKRTKESLEHSRGAAKAVNSTIQTSPELFLDTMAATKDRTDDWYVQKVLYQLFPEIPANKEKERERRGGKRIWEGLFGGSRPDRPTPRPETYLSEVSSVAIHDGDPKAEESPEVIRMREELNEMIATGIYGKYDKTTKEWSPVQFPVIPDLNEPVKEYTFELPNIKGLDVIHLPQLVGAEIIRDRVKGITKSGKEIKLDTMINSMGQVTASVLGVKDEVVRILYSQARQEIPIVPADISETKFQTFREGFFRSHGRETVEEIAKTDSTLDLFISLIKDKSPKEKLEAVESYVRQISYYDFDNREMMETKMEAKNLEERFSMMDERMKELKRRKPELEKELSSKRYAGVCVDFALLTIALLRKAGIPSGFLRGFRPDSKNVTTGDAHGTAFAIWPKEKGYHIIPIDGTPDGVTAEEKSLLKLIQQPSLVEKEESQKGKKDAYIKEAEERFKEVQEMLANNDLPAIKNLTNGELESLLNVVLKYEVKEPHLDVLETMANAARYGGKGVPEKGNIKDEVEFRRFVEGEIVRLRGASKADSQTPAGEKLMTMITEFADAYERETKDRDKAFRTLERIVDLSSSKLNDIEKKAAIVVITYLRAKKMTK